MTAASYPYTSGKGTPGSCYYIAPLSPGIANIPLLSSPSNNSTMQSALAANSLSVRMYAGGTDF